MKLYRFYLQRSDFKINNHQNIQILMCLYWITDYFQRSYKYNNDLVYTMITILVDHPYNKEYYLF